MKLTDKKFKRLTRRINRGTVKGIYYPGSSRFYAGTRFNRFLWEITLTEIAFDGIRLDASEEQINYLFDLLMKQRTKNMTKIMKRKINRFNRWR